MKKLVTHIRRNIDVIFWGTGFIVSLVKLAEPAVTKYGLWEAARRAFYPTIPVWLLFSIVFITPMYFYIKWSEKKQEQEKKNSGK